MARPKEFDRSQVLNKALDVFWCRGYAATSIQDLVEHTGVNRQSLYDTFGDKHALFLATMERYADMEYAKLQQQFVNGASFKNALRQVLENVVEAAVAGGVRRGCFIVNSATECAPHDPVIVERVLASFNGMEQTFMEAIERAQAAGEIDQAKDARALARFLVTTVQGLQVQAKVLPRPTDLRDVIDLTLAAI
jgi:TetR/AcrR family transcriptional regulator, transcriptional repressor for nem operon